jgi:hypothetical protein
VREVVAVERKLLGNGSSGCGHLAPKPGQDPRR